MSLVLSPRVGWLCPASLPFDGAKERGARLVVKRDDDTRGGKVSVIIQGCTPTEREREREREKNFTQRGEHSCVTCL